MVDEVVVEDLVTPERKAKGDLEFVHNNKGRISHAAPARLTIIKELIRRDVLPYHYEIYGFGFLELRDVFLNPWAYRSAAQLLEQWGAGTSDTRAGDIYQNVCRVLGQERIPVIQYVMGEDKAKEDKEHHVIYKECFEKLATAMDEERERIKNL